MFFKRKKYIMIHKTFSCAIRVDSTWTGGGIKYHESTIDQQINDFILKEKVSLYSVQISLQEQTIHHSQQTNMHKEYRHILYASVIFKKQINETL